MKQATIRALLALVLSASAAFAQIPDTTSAERYLPLEVGNVWEYESWVEECLDIKVCWQELVGYQRWMVEQESVIGGQAYSLLAQDILNLDGEVDRTHRLLVRFDASQAMGVGRLSDGSEIAWPSYYLPCRLDAPFEAEVECGEGTIGEVFTSEPGEILVDVDGETETRVVKSYQSLIPGSTFAADVGLMYEGGTEFGGGWISLTYARVGDLEYGTERFPVATEEVPPETALALSVYPNPTPGDATVQFSLEAPQQVTVAVYDVLARRVLAEDLGVQAAGEASHRLDVARLPAGVYLVRLTGDAGAMAMTRIVRQ